MLLDHGSARQATQHAEVAGSAQGGDHPVESIAFRADFQERIQSASPHLRMTDAEATRSRITSAWP